MRDRGSVAQFRVLIFKVLNSIVVYLFFLISSALGPSKVPVIYATTLAYYSMERGAGVGVGSGLELPGTELCLQDLVNSAGQQHSVHAIDHIQSTMHHHANLHHDVVLQQLHNGNNQIHQQPLEKLKRGESILKLKGFIPKHKYFIVY